MSVRRIDCSALLALVVIGAATTVQAADAERGRLLYEGHCNVCHNTGVHLRASRKARTFEGIREQVVRWNNELGGAWRREDFDDVTLYLNNRYYFYRCPESICGVGQAQAPQQ
jgi:mono/diheme cytochrome c family protein